MLSGVSDNLDICLVFIKIRCDTYCFISVSGLTQDDILTHHEQDIDLRRGDDWSGRPVLWILGLGCLVRLPEMCLPCVHSLLLHHLDDSHGDHLQDLDSTAGAEVYSKMNHLYSF